MSHKSLSRLRAAAFLRQSGACFYCSLPMWLTDPLSFSRHHSLSMRQTKLLQCTAEHLKARCEGGIDSPANVVAACLRCNRQRHRSKVAPSPDRHRQRIQKLMVLGRWHRFNR